MEEVVLEVGGQKVNARLFKPAKPNGGGVILIHGWRSDQTSPRPYAEALATQGFTTLTFDLRGMGESEGDIKTLTRHDYLADCLAVYDYLKNQGIDKICIVGSSFGSYLACLLSGERAVHSMVLRVPANYPDDNYSEPQYIFSDLLDKNDRDIQRQSLSDSHAIRALKKFNGRVLVVESGRDEIINHETVQSFADAVPKSKLTYYFMKDAPHSLSLKPKFKEEFCDLLVSWVGKDK